MEVSNCKSCGRIFNVLHGEKICPNCKKALDEKFDEVKTYINDNKNCTVDMVSEATGVSGKQIRQWIREERLVLTAGALAGIECEKCGTPIATGRYCEKCKANISSSLTNAFAREAVPTPKKPERDGDRMRFIQR